MSDFDSEVDQIDTSSIWPAKRAVVAKYSFRARFRGSDRTGNRPLISPPPARLCGVRPAGPRPRRRHELQRWSERGPGVLGGSRPQPSARSSAHARNASAARIPANVTGRVRGVHHASTRLFCPRTAHVCGVVRLSRRSAISATNSSACWTATSSRPSSSATGSRPARC